MNLVGCGVDCLDMAIADQRHFRIIFEVCTVLPAKLTSTNGSTRFFRFDSKPRNCFMPSIKASSTKRDKASREKIKYVLKNKVSYNNFDTHIKLYYSLWGKSSDLYTLRVKVAPLSVRPAGLSRFASMSSLSWTPSFSV